MAILRTLLSVTLYSTVLFVAVSLFRLVMGKRLSPALRLALWGLVLARLLIPATLESPIHLPGRAAVSAAVQAGYDRPLLTLGTVRPARPDAASAGDAQAAHAEPAAQADSSGLRAQITVTWADALLLLWAAGMLVRGGLLLRAERRMRRVLRESALPPSPRVNGVYALCRDALGVTQPLPLLVLERITTPALTVGFRPKLVLPRRMADTLTDQQLTFALSHELTHYRRGDHLLCLLLRAVETVYWFHPVAWLLSRRVEADMETACDSRVVRGMAGTEKKAYALTLVAMFSQSSQPRFVLGMAREQTREAAEARVRGVFAKGRSKPSVKAVSALLALLLLAGCFTTACQPTPEAPPVIGKNDGALESIILSTQPPEGGQNAPPDPASPRLAETLGAPAHWTEEPVTKDVPKAALTVQVDADVNLPNVSQAAVFSAAGLTDGSALTTRLIEKLFGDSQLYIGQHDTLKANVQHWIEYEQTQLADIQAHPEQWGDSYNSIVEDYQRRIREYLAEYETAPSEYENLVPWDGNAAVEALNLMAPTGETGRYARFEAYLPHQISFYSGARISDNLWALPKYAPETAEEQASAAVADAFVQEMGLTQFRFYSIVPGMDAGANNAEAAAASQRGQVVTMIPYYGGIPLYALSGKNGSDTAVQRAGGDAMAYYDETQYGRAPDPERLTLTILDGEVVEMMYTGPIAVTGTDNENVQLLPFAEIQKRFLEQIFRNYYLDEGYPTTLIITGATLSMMRVRKKDHPDESYLLPVWDFTGYDLNPWLKDDPVQMASYIQWWSGQSVMTLNAVDGSIVNRYLGY